MWKNALINFTDNGSLVGEWWVNKKKLTVYIEEEGIYWIKVFEDGKIEDGATTNIKKLSFLFQWLNTN